MISILESEELFQSTSGELLTPKPHGMGGIQGDSTRKHRNVFCPQSVNMNLEETNKLLFLRDHPHLLNSYLCLLFFDDNLQDTNMYIECRVSQNWKFESNSMCLGSD